MKKIVFILSLLACQSTVFAQLGVGTNSPDASAQLDVTASNKGFLAPRIALTSATDVTTIATPATGLMIYNTATTGTSPNNVIPGYYYYDGTKWVRFINSQPSATISFNTADPNSGSPTFTPNTTQNSGYIYVSSTNSSLWVWNGSAYVSYATPASTPFSLSGTSTDAGGNKTASIYRSGGIIAGGTSSSAMYGNLTAVGGSNFSGAIPNGTASIGLISNSTAGWSGTGFLFGNANSGSNAFSLVVNNDKHYHAWLTPTNTYNLTSISNATGWIFGSNLNAGWTPTYALEARGELASTSNAYFGTAGGAKVGVSTTTPISQIANTNTATVGSDGKGTNSLTLTTGVGWAQGYVASLYNSLNDGTSGRNGLAIKVAQATSSTYALDISQGTAAGTAGSPLFDVLGNGNVGIRTNSPATSLHMNSNLVATNTINADGQMLRMTRPVNPAVKWDNIAQFNLGAYDATSVNASTRLDLALNDGAGVTTANVMTWLANGRVGIGSSNPYTQLDVNGNIYTSVHANSNLHDAGEQISRFIGHKSGNSSDGFSGMENEIGNYGNTGQSNGSKIHFLTWSNNLSASRRVATISQYGNFGIDNTAPAINLSVGSTNLSQKMGRAIVNANNQHHSDKRDAFQIGRWDGTSAHDDYFTGIKYNVTAGATVGETWDNQSFLTFFTWGSNISSSREVMRLDQRGRLGIGTNSPSATLEVATTGIGALIRRASTSLAASNLILQKSASSDPAVNTALANGDYVGRILFSAGNGTNYPLNGTDIVGYAVGAQTTTNNGGGMFFRTVPQNSVSQSIERMRIEHNGNVGIGTTAPTTNLDVVGGFSLRNVTGAAGTNYGIEFNTNSTAPRIDWVFNGAYIGQFASDANDFHLRNSKLSTGGFRFFTNPAGSQVERLTILNNGYVGVGVASPVSTLANTSLPIQGSNTPNAFNGGLTWSTPGTGFAASFYSQPSNGNGLLVKIAGNSSSNNAFEVSSSISQESNVNNPINPLFNVKGNGNVGVGTFTPASKLEVNGSATNTSAFSAGSGTTINFANSNLAYTTASAGSFTLSNIKDGGTYTLAVQGATSGTASFTCSGFTFISVNNGITAPNKHTLYTFIVMGTNVYVYMATGF